ncbi:MAG TPA: translation initiation factor IF-2 associated domain-containing protein, partial [Allosphingosinicella sp.]
MSDTTDKPKLGARAPLGIKRTVETGKVKQSFSHGRSNTVVVEVKKRRILGPAPVQEAPAPAPEPTPVPAPAARAPEPTQAAPQRPANDAASRRELQEKLLREAEEARLSSLEEARRRESREAQEATEDEKRRADDNRRADEEARERAEEEAKRAAEAPAPAADAAPAAAPAMDDDDDRRPGHARPKHHAPGAKRPEPARPGRGAPRGDDRRHSGKLTVTRALSGDDDRARSLAALRRAREKDKRHHMQSGPSAKQVRDVVVPDAISVQELANRMAERA